MEKSQHTRIESFQTKGCWVRTSGVGPGISIIYSVISYWRQQSGSEPKRHSIPAWWPLGLSARPQEASGSLHTPCPSPGSPGSLTHLPVSSVIVTCFTGLMALMCSISLQALFPQANLYFSLIQMFQVRSFILPRVLMMAFPDFLSFVSVIVGSLNVTDAMHDSKCQLLCFDTQSI